jgi:hypothetical protein
MMGIPVKFCFSIALSQAKTKLARTVLVQKFRIEQWAQRKSVHMASDFGAFQSWHAPCFISPVCRFIHEIGAPIEIELDQPSEGE